MSNNGNGSNHGFLKFLIVIIITLAIAGLAVYVTKCAINEKAGGNLNTDGNPIFLNRPAVISDFSLSQSVDATITNLKDSYVLTPNVDIKDLELTFKYYDKAENLVVTKTVTVGNVKKASQYTVSIDHKLSDLFKISTYTYYVTGGTVSYFS